jgi:hypothetical protein
MAWWRDVEQALASRSALERHASEVAAPFFHSDVAWFMSTTMVHTITRQALVAMASGTAACTPLVEGPARMFRQVVVFMERRGRWLEEMSALIGLPPLDADLAGLRRRATGDIQRQVDAAP